jgi:hypothetical protein
MQLYGCAFASGGTFAITGVIFGSSTTLLSGFIGSTDTEGSVLFVVFAPDSIDPSLASYFQINGVTGWGSAMTTMAQPLSTYPLTAFSSTSTDFSPSPSADVLIPSPEPGTLALVGFGALAGYFKRKQKR